jgi:tetratricopeptide (TPR) repeat protein
LFYTLGARPEFGKSPAWHSIVDTLRSGCISSWQLQTTQFPLVRRWLAPTHVVISHIEGGTSDSGPAAVPEGTLTLTLQLYDAVSARPVGREIRLTGSADEISRQLSRAAADFTSALGIANAGPVAAKPISAEQLTLVGQLPIDPYGPVDLKLVQRLRETSPQTPFVQMVSWRPENYRTPLAKIDLTPETATLQALGFLESYDTEQLNNYGAIIQSLAAKYPNNSLSQGVYASTALERKEYAVARKAAERATRCALDNAASWDALSAVFARQASDLRQGRVVGEISNDEWEQLIPLYAAWEASARRTTELNPDSGEFWLNLSQAATFLGHEETGKGAFWKAVKLEPRNQHIFGWGLEMFQPKWGGEKADLLKVISLVSADDYLLSTLISETLGALSLLDWQADRGAEITKALFPRYLHGEYSYYRGARAPQGAKLGQLWVAAWKQPDNAAGWRDLDLGLTQAADDVLAGPSRNPTQYTAEEYEVRAFLHGFARLAALQEIHLQPQSASAWVNYSKANYNAPGYREDARPALETAVRLDPKNVDVVLWQIEFANLTGLQGREGMIQVLERVASDTALVDAAAYIVVERFGGRTWSSLPPEEQKWMTLAQASLLKQSEIDDAAIQRRLTTLSWWQRDRSRALRTAQNWARLAPNDADAHFYVADFGNRVLTPAEIEAQYRETLRLDPAHLMALYHLALLLENQGRTEEAETLFSRISELQPQWAEPMFYHAQYLQRAGKTAEARKLWQQVVNLRGGGYDMFLQQSRDALKATDSATAGPPPH